jgi:hypothetical protein
LAPKLLSSLRIDLRSVRNLSDTIESDYRGCADARLQPDVSRGGDDHAEAAFDNLLSLFARDAAGEDSVRIADADRLRLDSGFRGSF